jgi:hypothetical protein
MKSGMIPASLRRNRKRGQRTDIRAATSSLCALSLMMRGEQRRRGRTVEHVRAARESSQISGHGRQNPSAARRDKADGERAQDARWRARWKCGCSWQPGAPRANHAVTSNLRPLSPRRAQTQ